MAAISTAIHKHFPVFSTTVNGDKMDKLVSLSSHSVPTVFVPQLWTDITGTWKLPIITANDKIVPVGLVPDVMM